MTQSVRLSILLVLLAVLAALFFYDLGRRSTADGVAAPLAKAGSTRAAADEIVSPTRQALRRGDFSGLDAEFARVEKAAEADAQAERTLKQMLTDLGHGSDDDLKQLERWAGDDSHYAQLALSRAHRVRGFHVRGTDYANKIDPLRLARFAEHNRASIAHAEQALKAHADCGVAYGQIIEALVGNSSRKEIDAMYRRAEAAAPRWYSAAQSYSYALHPKWYGRPGERRQFIDEFARRHPGHRAAARLQAIDHVWQADAAINDRNYGEAMIFADQAIELDPGNSYAWLNKGRAYAGVQRAIQALQAMDRAIQLDPFNDTAYRERGRLRLVMAQPAGQDDLVQAGLLGDSWALKQAMWNWITGNTTGVARDMARVPGVCERARAAGLPDGVFCVATVHYFGYGVPRDVKKGFEMMREAAELGVADAMSDVGKTYWTGEAAAGVAQNKEQALRWWIRAADIGNDRALVELSQVRKDPELLELVKKIRQEQQPPPLQVPPPAQQGPGAI